MHIFLCSSLRSGDDGGRHVDIDSRVHGMEVGDGLLQVWTLFIGVLRVATQEVLELWPFLFWVGAAVGGGGNCTILPIYMQPPLDVSYIPQDHFLN